MRKPRSFTLIELIAVIVVLAILAGVALPKYFDHSDDARESADEGAITAIRTALQLAHLDHCIENTQQSEWITSVEDIAAVMESKQLPQGIVISGDQLQDQRGNRYTLIPETATEPATLRLDGTGSSNGNNNNNSNKNTGNNSGKGNSNSNNNNGNRGNGTSNGNGRWKR